MEFLTPKRLVIMVLLFGLVVALSFGLLFFYLDEAQTAQLISNVIPQSTFGFIFLFLLISLATGVGLPRQVAAFIAGFLCGENLGTFIALLGVSTGCVITYSASKVLAQKYLKQTSPDLIKTAHMFFSQQTFWKAFVIRILPVGSNFITNILAGLSQAPARGYILGSALGFIPQLYIFALAGSGIRLNESDSLYISLGLFALAFVLGTWLYKRSKVAIRMKEIS